MLNLTRVRETLDFYKYLFSLPASSTSSFYAFFNKNLTLLKITTFKKIFLHRIHASDAFQLVQLLYTTKLKVYHGILKQTAFSRLISQNKGGFPFTLRDK